ncbi:MAG: hypothetical protein RLZZ387_847 [Chloroflexota bacterium]|jgi:hypothetical protein
MTTEIAVAPELVVRSLDASWNYERWSRLPDDGNRYEVIDGVLYMTTAPSFFHQWIIRYPSRSFTQPWRSRSDSALISWAMPRYSR